MAGKSIFDLSGKVALVTGGGSGFGRAYCEGLAEYGADVACCDIIEERAEKTVELVEKFGHRAIAITADVSKPDEIEHMVNQTEEKLGSPDIVFANAGTTDKTRGVRLHEKTIEDWDHTLDLNLKGVFLLMRSVFPRMITKKAGNFITTASIGGFSTERSATGSACNKWAVMDGAWERATRSVSRPFSRSITSTPEGRSNCQFDPLRATRINLNGANRSANPLNSPS